MGRNRMWAMTSWLLLAALLLSGCARPERTGFSQAELAAAVIPDIPQARYWLDGSDLPSLLAPPASRPGEAVTVLALSGGADRGAYGAGFLNGWSRSGQRPDFTVVTGVSTGALMAPFAFLGPEFDPQLETAFTGLGPSDIYRLRFPLAIPFSISAVSGEPLRRRIGHFVTNAVIDRVAAEHRKGRRLYVLTANIDAARGVVWDMGAIAASTAPDRYALFRQVLLASAFVPAVFPPVAIESRAGGRTLEEWHVDGGTVAPLLAPPLMAGNANRPIHLYVLVNEKLGGDFDVTRPGIMDLAERAFELSVQTNLQRQAADAWSWAGMHGADYHLTYIHPDFDWDDHDYFATDYMQALFDYGLKHGAAAEWDAKPPAGGGPETLSTPGAGHSPRTRRGPDGAPASGARR